MKSFKHGIGAFHLAVALGAVAMACVLSGCATPIKSEDLSRIKTIGIVSYTGSVLTLLHGDSSFGSVLSNNNADISDWGIDAAIIEEATRALGGRFAVRELAYDPTPPPFAVDFNTEHNIGLVELVRRSLGPHTGEPVDAYIVIYPWVTPDIFHGRAFEVGIGVYESTNFLTSWTAVYTASGIVVLDGRTFEQLGEARLRSSTEAYRYFVRVDRRGLFAETFDQLSAAQKQEINTLVKELLRDEIPATLRTLRLIP
jgi:hypothetical protein